jgi:hypothetical protein
MSFPVSTARVEHAGVDARDRNAELTERLADLACLGAAGVIELSLLVDVVEIERVGVGLIGMRRPVPEYDHIAALAQGVEPLGLRRSDAAAGCHDE